jgi:hypothetical protein
MRVSHTQMQQLCFHILISWSLIPHFCLSSWKVTECIKIANQKSMFGLRAYLQLQACRRTHYWWLWHLMTFENSKKRSSQWAVSEWVVYLWADPQFFMFIWTEKITSLHILIKVLFEVSLLFDCNQLWII